MSTHFSALIISQQLTLIYFKTLQDGAKAFGGNIICAVFEMRAI